jgi:hypothetical protein
MCVGLYRRMAYKVGVPQTPIEAFYSHEKLDHTVQYIGVDEREDSPPGGVWLERFLNPSRPGNGVSGPAAPHFTDVPARSQ